MSLDRSARPSGRARIETISWPIQARRVPVAPVLRDGRGLKQVSRWSHLGSGLAIKHFAPIAKISAGPAQDVGQQARCSLSDASQTLCARTSAGGAASQDRQGFVREQDRAFEVLRTKELIVDECQVTAHCSTASPSPALRHEIGVSHLPHSSSF